MRTVLWLPFALLGSYLGLVILVGGAWMKGAHDGDPTAGIFLVIVALGLWRIFRQISYRLRPRGPRARLSLNVPKQRQIIAGMAALAVPRPKSSASPTPREMRLRLPVHLQQIMQ